MPAAVNKVYHLLQVAEVRGAFKASPKE